jgi:hypothetical protein
MNFDYLVPVFYFTALNFTVIVMKEEDKPDGMSVAFTYYLN